MAAVQQNKGTGSTRPLSKRLGVAGMTATKNNISVCGKVLVAISAARPLRERRCVLSLMGTQRPNHYYRAAEGTFLVPQSKSIVTFKFLQVKLH
ncbi:hypothetical protein AVEN_156426-1 [Araneus ventricosus]|uniref:Uncharacterized protein n=1 Tax=Araneus ventricosus TaxID=182803 RepID=A0A4Y2VD51_ARAVE|nr:hypothetical protein AVEN_156426-1 [Araneus ventricosus]